MYTLKRNILSRNPQDNLLYKLIDGSAGKHGDTHKHVQTSNEFSIPFKFGFVLFFVFFLYWQTV